MGFLSSLAGCAGRASATGTLTPRTQSHVTHKPANASGACITQTATHVLSVNQVIMEMHSLRTVGVSTVTLKLQNVIAFTMNWKGIYAFMCNFALCLVLQAVLV